MRTLQARIHRFMARLHTPPITLAAGLLTIGAWLIERFSPWNGVAVGAYLLVTVICGLPILYRALSGLLVRAIGIELLVSIAVIGAFIIGAYSEAGIVTFLFQLGGYLEQKTLEKTRRSIRALTELAPATAWCLRDGVPVEIAVDEVNAGDCLLVKTGGKVPVDGTILTGEGYLNEASITGESALIHRRVGGLLYAGTLLDSGTLTMEATRVGEDTTFSKIIALVEEAQDAKSPVERFIDRFAQWYTPAVVVLAALVWAVSRDVSRSITVLVLACPGALVIGAPVANVAGVGRGAKGGIFLKGGDSVHTFAKTDTILFDKTGTLTEGKPGVTTVFHYTEDRNTALVLAAAAESTSDHPLAAAVRRYAADSGISAPVSLVHSQTEKGLGISALVDGKTVFVGSARWMERCGIQLTDRQWSDLSTVQNGGASSVLVAVEGKLLLTLAVSDVIRADAAQAVSALKRLGIRRTVMLTGDNRQTALAVAKRVGIDEVQADLLPEEKLAQVQQLQVQGHIVAFVGDGINDSPALAAAHTGIAVGGGTDVAVETSDVVLMRPGLTVLIEALWLSKRTAGLTRQNIAIAVGTVILLLIGLIAGYIEMASGMFIHEASILVVILNAMRLLRMSCPQTKT